LIVTTGKNYITNRMANAADAVMSHIAVGTSATAAALADTTLVAEIARAANSSAIVTANIITYSATFEVGVGTGAITEAGIFNNAVAGTMLARTTFAVINKTAGDVIIFNWAVTNS
jgi:hypothetical protein